MELGGFLMFFYDFRDSVVEIFRFSILRRKNFGGMKNVLVIIFKLIIFCLTISGNIVRTLRDARECFWVFVK